MKRVIALTLSVMMIGCASEGGVFGKVVAAGSAIYSYENLGNGQCKLNIDSGRDVKAVKIEIDKDCALKSEAGETSGVAEALSSVKEAIGLVGKAISPMP